jgi:hypothetical protein
MEQAPEPARRWFLQPSLAVAGGLAVAVAVIVAIVMSLPPRETSPDRNIVKGPKRGGDVVTMPLEVSLAEVTQLESGLTQLAQELDRLSEDAARLDARQAIDELAAAYQPLVPNDST